VKRTALVLVGLVVADGAIWGLVTGGPYLRWYVRVRWHAIEASRREPAALEAWRKEFGDRGETLAAVTTKNDKPTAVRLGEIGLGAGVNFKNPEYPASATAIAGCVNAEEMKTGNPVGPPPEAARACLDAHKPGLDAVVDLLTHAETPAWKADEWFTSSSASLAGLKQLS
jgi:hypothetical protein